MKRYRACRGFTMIEILVAVAVLALMSALLLQMVSMSSSAVSSSTKKLDGLAGARFALDRIGLDLGAGVKRKEVNSLFEKKQGNDAIAFYSEVDAYNGQRKISGVGYRIQSSAGQPFYLERGVRGEGWNETFPKAAPSMTDLDFDVLAEGVLRLEFGYVTKNGQFVSDQSLTDLSNVSAIVVAVAVLDSASRKMLTEAEVARLSDALQDAPSNGKDLISAWEAQLYASGLPPRAIQNVRIFQRFFYVR